MFDFRLVSTAADRVYGIKVKSEKDANDDIKLENQTFSDMQGHDVQVKIEADDDNTILSPLQGNHDSDHSNNTNKNDKSTNFKFFELF